MNDFQAAVADIIAKYKAAISDGKVTFAEVFALANAAVMDLVTAAEKFLGTAGPDKKTAVLQALSDFIDRVITPIDLPYVPNLVIESAVDASIKTLLLAAADRSIDLLVTFFQSNGWVRSVPVKGGE